MNNKLNAYVRFDGSGKIVPSSVILQRSKPKVGNWKEIYANECCNYTTTTTTTLSINICGSIYSNPDNMYLPSKTYIFTGNDVNGYPVYVYTPFEGPIISISYFIVEGVWGLSVINDTSIIISSNPTTTTNIYNVTWPGNPASMIISSTPCDI